MPTAGVARRGALFPVSSFISPTTFLQPTSLASRSFAAKFATNPVLPKINPMTRRPPSLSLTRELYGASAFHHRAERHADLGTTPTAGLLRRLHVSRILREHDPLGNDKDVTSGNTAGKTSSELAKAKQLNVSQVERTGFQRSAKAEQASHVNMRARLSKEGKDQKKAGSSDVWRLIKLARPELKLLSIAFVFVLISTAATLSIGLAVKQILDLSGRGITGDYQIVGLPVEHFFIGVGVIFTLAGFATFGRNYVLRIVGERVVARLRAQLYRKTYTQDAEFFDANRVGDIISRLGTDASIVGKSISGNLTEGLRSIIQGCAGFALMASISPKLMSIILVVAPPVAVGAFIYGRVTRNLSRQFQKNIGALTKIGEERLGNVRTGQAFVGEVQEVARYNKQIRKIFNIGKKDGLYTGIFYGTTNWAGQMTVLALLVASSNMLKTGAMSPGDLAAFLTYTLQTGGSLFSLTTTYSEFMRAAGAATRLFELEDRKPSISATRGVKVVSAHGSIKFSDVSFAYPTRPAVMIFNGLSFELEAGSNACIVGPSGGGKSTVAGLLLRFYDPTSGSIKIDGVDISTMNLKSLRRRIAIVSQEPVLFSGTIAENIAYGKPDATRSDIIVAAQKANCQFIGDFPDGLDTQVGARGAMLSGGQKQRIAIARALIKDPDILILDEATSALDAESETLVNSALAALLKGRSTTISIAHRLSTIKRSDQIIVLGSNGTVAEIGSYVSLSADPDSAFSKLMEWQMSGGEVPNRPANGHVTEEEEIEEVLEEGLEEEHDDEPEAPEGAPKEERK